MEGAMDDDEDDKSLVEKTIEAVKDIASSVTDAAKSAATPNEEEKMTVMDVPLVADAAAMPMPLEKRERRRKVKLDRKHLEARSRRFLKSYLNADETRRPQFYRAVEEASKECQPVKLGLPPPELEDAQIAEATSGAAMKMVLEREERGALKKDDRISDFVTDAYATVGIAYHRAAGVYTMDKEMQELGTAAVHLLTMATSYMRAQND
jgi:hypothetical protein